jgi:ligand-binding sensor domain-containing protein
MDVVKFIIMKTTRRADFHRVRVTRLFLLALLLVATLVLLPSCEGLEITSPGAPIQTIVPTERSDLEDESGTSLTTRTAGRPGYSDIQFDQLSLDQGLSQVVVMDILQDSRGFMWFTTQDGLNRYDGYEFKWYKHDPEDPTSISNNFQLAIAEDPSGDLWIGTNGGGLNQFDRETETFIRFVHDPDDPNSISSDQIEDVYAASDGIVWVATMGGGLDRFDPATQRFEHYRHNPDDETTISGDDVQRIYEDPEGRLWIGTHDNGLNQFNRETGEFTRYLIPEPEGKENYNCITAVLQDSLGTLWVGTYGGGLYKLDPISGRFDKFKLEKPGGDYVGGPIKALVEDSHGNLWAGIDGAGLIRVDLSDEDVQWIQNDPEDLSSLSINQVYSVYSTGARRIEQR